MNAAVQWTLDNYGDATYRIDEMEHLYVAALSVPAGGTIVEIGTYAGCSASLLLQAAKPRRVVVTMIDSCAWMWTPEVDARLNKTIMEKAGDCIRAIPAISRELAKLGTTPIDMLHIDGDHSKEGVRQDCESWLPLLKSDGLACFHDYRGSSGQDPFPGMPDEVDRQTAGYKDVWHGGELGLLIRRKP